MKLTDRNKIEVVELYQGGESTKSIADKFGVSKSNIIQLLHRRGCNIRPKHQWRKYSFDYNFFDTIDTPEKAYFLGFLYADGCFYEPHRKITIQLSDKDKEILEKFKILLNSTAPINLTTRIRKENKIFKYCTFDMVDEHFSERCRNLGIIPRKSLVLEFPREEQVPSYLIRHFVRGYFDGDGSIYKTVKKSGFNCYNIKIISTKNFCEELNRIIIDIIGVGGTIIKYKTCNMYCLSFQGGIKAFNFAKWMYDGATIYLDRKYEIFKEFASSCINQSLDESSRTKKRIDKLLTKDYNRNYLKDVVKI